MSRQQKKQQQQLKKIPSTHAFIRDIALVQSERSPDAAFFRTADGKRALLERFGHGEDMLDGFKPWHQRLKELFHR